MEDLGSVENALADVTNSSADTVGIVGYVPRNAEAAQIAREKGWSNPVPYDYVEYENKDSRNWAGVAARYEWKDEYGEVGPPNEALENELFRGDFIPRVGQRFDAYVLRLSRWQV